MSFNNLPKNEDSSATDRSPDAEIDSLLGRRVGIYILEKRIGKGGMGAVYLASRADGEFHQQVAVKLVKRGMDTDFVLNRFRHERQILASLEHPFIARLLDGGTTDDGLPYFVMDFIKGEPLIEYAEKSKLDLRARLELFRRVCEAVQFAHQKQIVHRDLKPPNILVTASGTPKLLDFGIAKLLNPEDANETLLPTQTQMRLMTAEYAAPEQIRGEAITAATDVYSLGVLLYELLTGARPYKFPSRAPHEVARVICEQEVENPKSKIQNLKNEGGSEDLSNIILKALQKKPSDRYVSVKEFSADIERFLKGKAVTAKLPVSKNKSVQPSVANTPTASRSIAVLPLKFFGAADADDKFLSIGLADALIARLSGVKRFVLRPTSSVLRYGETDVDSFKAGEDLGVEFVVDGHIQKLGERLRISVQLLNVAERTTVWAERFDEKTTDVLELEDAISNRVAESLIPRLTGEERRRLEKRGTNNPQAYEAYLRGRYFYNKFTGEDLPKAVESFREAIRLDANYALPHVGIADFFAWSAIFGEIPSLEAFPQAAVAARRALEIDAGLGEAYAILAFATFLHDWDRYEAFRLVRKAIELSPNYGFAHECYSNFLASSGQFDEAVVEIKRAEELDPLSPRPMLMTAWTLYQTRHFDEAAAKARRANALEKDFPQGLLHLGNTLTATGETEEAVRVLEQGYRLWNGSGLPGYMLCHALVADGRREEARKVLTELHESAAVRHVKPFFLGMAHAALDERDAAFEWFERAFAERSEWMIWFGTETKLDSLRDDSRYHDLLRRTKSPLAKAKTLEVEKPSTGSEKSIAVLPLKLFGSATGSDDEYLGIGLADALVTKLSNVRRFVVRPTSSVLPFNELGVDPFTAGSELGVDFVVDGNIRRVGERIRVSVQLLDVKESASRWADQFDEHFTDVLELEDAISKRVAESLIPRLTDDERVNLARRDTKKSEAFEAYMRGRFHWNQFTPESLPKALASFQKAIEIDPDYALAYVGLGDFYIWANIYGIIPSFKATPLAEAAARRAIELNPEQGEAYATLGLVRQNQKQWDEAIRLFKKSLELQPNYIHAHEWYGAMLVGMGDFETGVAEIKSTEKIDPLSMRTKTLAAWTFYQAGQFEETLERGKQIVDLDKNYPQGYSQMGFGLLMLGQAEEALVNFQKFDRMISGSPLAKYQLCFALVAVNRLNEARLTLEEIKTLAANGYVKPYFLAMAHTALGEYDAAFGYFEQAFAENDPWLLWLGTEPMLAVLRDDERYFDLLRRMQNPIIEQQTKSKNLPTASEKSIAVLPLKILTSNTLDDDEYLSVGLADALITRLSNVRRFIVRPTSSVLKFAGDAIDSYSAGRKLGVDYIVEGNIRRAGDRIRVTIQLLSIGENASHWADKFDEHFTDVLELEDSISERVAESLIPQLVDAERERLKKRGTNNPQAYEAYLRGRFYWSLQSEDSFAKAITFFERAVELDPNYALAYTAIAEYYIFLGIHCVVPFIEKAQDAKELVEKAVRLDSSLAAARAMLGFIEVCYNRDWAAAEKHLRHALRLNPNSVTAHNWLSTVLLQTRRFDEAVGETDRVIELDPDSLVSLHLKAWTLYHSRRFAESIEFHQKLLKSASNYAWGLQTYSWTLRRVGRFDEAVAPAERSVQLTGENPFYLPHLASAYAEAGMRDRAEDVLARLDEISKTRFVSEYMLALAYCALGDKDRAFENLEKAFAARDGWLNWLAIDPQFDVLREDARYEDLLRRMKHPLAP